MESTDQRHITVWTTNNAQGGFNQLNLVTLPDQEVVFTKQEADELEQEGRDYVFINPDQAVGFHVAKYVPPPPTPEPEPKPNRRSRRHPVTE